MSINQTECKSTVGITVGLIDSVMTICHVIAQRLRACEAADSGFYPYPSEVLESLKDIYSDDDLKYVLSAIPRWVEGVKKVYPQWPGPCITCRIDHDPYGPCPQNEIYLMAEGTRGEPKERDTTRKIVYDYRIL